MLIAVISGIIGAFFVYAFQFILNFLQSFADPFSPKVILYAAAGALAASIISMAAVKSRGESIPSYIRGIRDNGGQFSIKNTVVTLFSSIATLGTWGNGGIVAPLGRVTAGFTSWLSSLVNPETGDNSFRRTAAIAGMAATVSSITGAPIASGIMAVEIIQKRDMRYSDLFPSILAASTSYIISTYLGIERIFNFETVKHIHFNIGYIPVFLLTAVAAAAAGHGFEKFYSVLKKIVYNKYTKKAVVLRFTAATVISVSIFWFINPYFLGTGSSFQKMLFVSSDISLWHLSVSLPVSLTAAILIILRAFSVNITVASGQNVGFFAPLTQIGMLIGTMFAALFGFFGRPEYVQVLQAAGMSAMLASTMNIPLASAVLVSELFGMRFGLIAAFASILAFQLNRHHTIYDMILEEPESKDSINS